MKRTYKEILSEAHERIRKSYVYEYDNRHDAEMCANFIDGKQWDPEEEQRRRRHGLSVVTVNKLRKFALSVFGNIIEQMPGVKLVPKGGAATVEGAALRTRLIRHTEDISNAIEAYTAGLLQAIEGGYGIACRILTRYIKGTFDKEIIIEPIHNRFAVIFDKNAQKKCFEDSEYAFVVDKISKKEFERLYPKANMSSFEMPMNDFVWYYQDDVVIAEYFWKEHKKYTIYELENGQIIKKEELEQIKEAGIWDEVKETVVRKRTEWQDEVWWAKLSYDEILEGPYQIEGEYIPIVPIIAHEFNDSGIRRFRGIAFDAMDSARMYNYWKSSIIDILASAPKTTRLIDPRQEEGYEQEWDDINERPLTRLHYNAIPGIPDPIFQAPMPIPTGAAQEAAACHADMEDTIGRYAENLGQNSNARTGRAMRMRQMSGNQTMISVVKNFQSSLLYVWKIINNMIPEVYNTQRVINMMTRNGELEQVVINNPSVNLKSSTIEKRIENDLTQGEYDMVPAIGPNSVTQRQEIVASMLDFLQFFPVAGPILGPKIASLMDWEGSAQLGEELKAIFQQQAQSAQQETAGTKTAPGTEINNMAKMESNF